MERFEARYSSTLGGSAARRLGGRERGDGRQSRQPRGYWRPPVPSATAPKSVVQYQPYGEPATYSLPMPIARYVALSMFALWPGLLRQASNTACALTYPAAMFSPM